VFRLSGIHQAFPSVLKDPGLWGGAPSVLGWVGSMVNQHCQLRLGALLGFGGEYVLGGTGTTLGDWWVGAAQSLVYCEYLGY
jgi:hypothetical protein